MTYHHLTQDERYQIHALRRQNISLARIAGSPSTISRELKSNVGTKGYTPVKAHTTARTRQTARRNARQFTAAQWAQVQRYLRLLLSPE